MSKKHKDGTRETIPIVSSAHLVSGRAAELSEFEYGLIVADNAFSRWTQRCMAAAGGGDMSPLDVLVIHSVNHRGRDKRLSDICFILNVEDQHTVTYSLKKLAGISLIKRHKKGKETFFSVTEKGQEVCQRYREVREDCLVSSLHAVGLDNDAIGDLARRLRALSGLYDQAARAATSL